MSLSAEAILNLLEAHPYLLLFPLVLVEGPISTVVAGLLVATGVMVLPIAYAVAVIADLTGDSFYYLLGRSARYPRAARLLDRLGFTQEKLTTMEASFGRNYGKALVGAKVADFAAIPVFLAAGLSKIGYGRFLAWTAAATVPKSGLLLLGGYFVGDQALVLVRLLTPGPIASLALLSIVPIAYLLIVKKVLVRSLGRGPKDAKKNQTQTSYKGELP